MPGRIKLAIPDRVFIPDVTFDTDDGPVRNRDLPDEDRVTASITMASNGQRTRYLGSYTEVDRHGNRPARNYTHFQYNACVTKHVTSIAGLEENGITDGKSLVGYEPTPSTNALIHDLFMKVCGLHADDNPEKDGDDSGDGVMTEGED